MIGLVFWPHSPRAATEEQARRVREAVPEGIALVGVFVDEEPGRIDELVASIGLDRVQLHGAEPRSLVERYGERAIRGVRDGDVSDVPPGIPVVYDRPWGETRDVESLYAHWRLASRIVGERPLLLAGRLDPDNVAQAVREVRPWGVDCASGVERSAGIKDHERVRRLVAAAKEAA
jgi:phosphoribosylanthranilate isomerase